MFESPQAHGNVQSELWHARGISIELRHFRSFVAVAEEGKIGRAAERLYITQPALSRQIQQLEQEIGEPLLERVPHGVELTDAGRKVLDKARVAIEAADDALAVGDAEPHGRLVVGHPVAGGRERWFALSQAFVERFPAVEIEVRESMSELLQRQVLAREIDCALALAPNRLAGLIYTHVADDRLAAWLNPGHPLAARSELALSDLDGEEITILGGPGRNSGFNAAIKALFDGTAIEPRFAETTQIYPPQAAQDECFLALTVRVSFADEVVAVPIVPPRTLPFEFVQRAETNRSAVRAYGRFAIEHLAAQT